jgi:WD40 repeat protein
MRPCAEDGGPALAVACDDGVLRLFGAGSSAEVGMQFRRTFGRVQGRVLSVAWHPSGLSLATGHSDGCIRAWDTETTQEIYRITACECTDPATIHQAIYYCYSTTVILLLYSTSLGAHVIVSDTKQECLKHDIWR